MDDIPETVEVCAGDGACSLLKVYIPALSHQSGNASAQRRVPLRGTSYRPALKSGFVCLTILILQTAPAPSLLIASMHPEL